MFRTFLCSSCAISKTFNCNVEEQYLRQMKPRIYRRHPLNRHLEVILYFLRWKFLSDDRRLYLHDSKWNSKSDVDGLTHTEQLLNILCIVYSTSDYISAPQQQCRKVIKFLLASFKKKTTCNLVHVSTLPWHKHKHIPCKRLTLIRVSNERHTYRSCHCHSS